MAAFLGNLLWSLVKAAFTGRLGKAVGTSLLIGTVMLLGTVTAWWRERSEVEQVLLQLLAVGLLVGLLWLKLRGVRPQLRARASSAGAMLGRAGGDVAARLRTVAPAVWVYMIYEFRDENDDLLPLTVGLLRGRRHLVYIGKTTSFDRRMEQHRESQPWWHDELVFELPGQFWTEDDALDFEQHLIETRCEASQLYDRPRENKEHNRTYDPARSRRMREKTSRELQAA